MLEQLPRVKLAFLPTALEHLPRLGKSLGVHLYVKRDDNTGLAMGGNKARKLEYLLGDALEQGADTLITTGGPQSNHCRMTAAVAAKFGLDCHLLFSGAEIDERQGNLYLDALLGAKLHFLGQDDQNLAEASLGELADTLFAAGKKPYIIPLGGSNPIGAVGYIGGVAEVILQSAADGLSFDYIVHASGSGGTQAGLLAGIKTYDWPGQIIGISISRTKERLAREVYELCLATLARAEVKKEVSQGDVVVYDEYVGDGYGVSTALSRSALHAFATWEGLLLDPVYTAKAAGGLFDLVRQGIIPQGSQVLFWHTGGIPTLFVDPNVYWPVKK